jgi:transcriptional regulator with XRE-family HTH domain
MPFENGRRVSQETFARKMKVHWVTVSSWERGKSQPTSENLVQIAEKTGKPIEFFFGDDEDEEAALRRVVEEFTDVLIGRLRMALSHEEVEA